MDLEFLRECWSNTHRDRGFTGTVAAHWVSVVMD